MKTIFTLAFILAFSVLIVKTNARPNRSKSSPSTEELVDVRSDFAVIDGHDFENGSRSQHSRRAVIRGPIWGFTGVKPEVPIDDEDDEGLRPISFVPSNEGTLAGMNAPPVEHGSIQADKNSANPIVSTAPKKALSTPTKCEAAIINCCRFSEPDRENCFEQLSCTKTYKTGKACLPEVIHMIIEKFIKVYSPR